MKKQSCKCISKLIQNYFYFRRSLYLSLGHFGVRSILLTTWPKSIFSPSATLGMVSYLNIVYKTVQLTTDWNLYTIQLPISTVYTSRMAGSKKEHQLLDFNAIYNDKIVRNSLGPQSMTYCIYLCQIILLNQRLFWLYFHFNLWHRFKQKIHFVWAHMFWKFSEWMYY